MTRGFTLLELIIVIIIVTILATLGFMQYAAVIEKSRGAEARSTIGILRSQLIGKSYESGYGKISAESLGIVAGSIPPTCASTNYFSYTIDPNCSVESCTFTATRCTIRGKEPQGADANTLQLIHDNASGTDTWLSTAGY